MSGGRLTNTPRTVTGRAMAILGAFSHGPPVLSLQDISRRIGLPTSTAHRLLVELVTWGALARIDAYSYRV